MRRKGAGTDPGHVLQTDGLRATDGCRPVVLHEFVERVKLDDPQKVLSSAVPQYFEVLHLVTKPDQTNHKRVLSCAVPQYFEVLQLITKPVGQ